MLGLPARLRRSAVSRADDVVYRLNSYLTRRLSVNTGGKPAQLLLFENYRRLRCTPSELPRFEDTGFGVFSQSDEDGLLLYALALAGLGTKRFLDIGCGQPVGANITNLAVNWGFRGLAIDGDERKIRFSRRWFARHGSVGTRLLAPRFVTTWVDPETINEFVREHGLEGDIDLLSIDIDGVDYWVWRALDVVQPRVVIIEYNSAWSEEASVTVPVDDLFTSRRSGYVSSGDRDDYRAADFYYGASLTAMCKLGAEKGYQFLGCNAGGWNAIFVRSDLLPGDVPSMSVAACLERHSPRARELVSRPGFEWQPV